MSEQDNHPESPTISEQIKVLADKDALVKQTEQLRYGQVVFEVREGKIYRVNVTCSLALKDQDFVPQTVRRNIYSSQKA